MSRLTAEPFMRAQRPPTRTPAHIQSVPPETIPEDYRWCLTGTPVQNSLSALFSLLHFLREQPWGSYSWWRQMIEQPFDNGDGRVMQRLQAVLQPLLLRRTKEATDKNGVPLLTLPERDDRVVPVLLSTVEMQMYSRLFSRSKTQFDGFVSSGVALKRYANCLQMLLRLRLLASHPSYCCQPRHALAPPPRRTLPRLLSVCEPRSATAQHGRLHHILKPRHPCHKRELNARRRATNLPTLSAWKTKTLRVMSEVSVPSASMRRRNRLRCAVGTNKRC